MAHHNVYTFFSVHNCLDEEFDAPDTATDHDLCRAIVAGRWGMHPDAWGAHDLLSTPPTHHRKPWRPPLGYPGDREVEWKPHKPRPTPVWRPLPPSPAEGTLQLTCDVCDRARFGGTVDYYGDRPLKVAAIRALGHMEGWTCIAGVDRCPQCSEVAAPKAKGNGAGGNQGNEQHA